MSATNRGAKRSPNDFYATPPDTVRTILRFIDWPRVNTMIEPCRGDGAITSLVPDHVFVDWAEIREGRDYLTTSFERADLVLTNPPFGPSLDFLKKSLTEAPTVIYLQRLNWLGAQWRRDFWQANLPTHVFVLSNRPRFIAGKSSDATEYAWFCWDRANLITVKTPINVV